MSNIARTLREVAAKYPAKTGLIEAKTARKLTFSELEGLSDGYARLLQTRGVQQSDRVILMVKPSAEFIALTFALFKLGSTIILIDPGMGYKNLLRCIERVKPTVFIGIPKACLVRQLFFKAFSSVGKTFCCGNSFGLFGTDIQKEVNIDGSKPFPIYQPTEDDLAAIIFTTGSTGPPKGVRYEHAIFASQLLHIKNYYGISHEDVDQPAFPLFALFSTALGACAVIPDMDPTRPAKVDPSLFVQSIEEYKVSYSFGSPAIWNVVSSHLLKENKRLPGLKKILMAGAPVPGELIERVSQVMDKDGRVFTPYGATESLPIVSMEGKEIVTETWKLTQQGKGTCVGRPLPGIEIRIIALEEKEIPKIEYSYELTKGEIGEIIVKGDVVTRAYDNNEDETKLAKIDGGDGTFWHRMGDVGYLDDQGRLWFCGRKAHRVKTARETKYTIPCEAIANNHPAVFRSAMVGVKHPATGDTEAVIIVEKNQIQEISDDQLLVEVRLLCRQSSLTSDIEHYLLHPSFPVDIRHNAKIFREKLSVWAQKKIYG